MNRIVDADNVLKIIFYVILASFSAVYPLIIKIIIIILN
jgi:hypothetical protein